VRRRAAVARGGKRTFALRRLNPQIQTAMRCVLGFNSEPIDARLMQNRRTEFVEPKTVDAARAAAHGTVSGSVALSVRQQKQANHRRAVLSVEPADQPFG
jgi:hypothetical protein